MWTPYFKSLTEAFIYFFLYQLLKFDHVHSKKYISSLFFCTEYGGKLEIVLLGFQGVSMHGISTIRMGSYTMPTIPVNCLWS